MPPLVYIIVNVALSGLPEAFNDLSYQDDLLWQSWALVLW